jgi:hypothetical protein
MTSWVFSATEPKEPEVGMVWFNTGNSSNVEFNALKKGTLDVCPIGAKQYVGGEFEKVTAMSYQGEAWVNWRRYLYNKGDLCEDITGGWSFVPVVYSGGSNPQPYGQGGTINFNEDHILLTSVEGKSTSIATNNKIDLTNVKTVHCLTPLISETEAGASHYGLRILSAREGKGIEVAAANYALGETEIDVSNLNGSYYIGYRYYSSANPTKITEFGME